MKWPGILLILCGGGAYWWWKHHNNAAANGSPSSGVTSITGATVQIIPDSLATKAWRLDKPLFDPNNIPVGLTNYGVATANALNAKYGVGAIFKAEGDHVNNPPIIYCVWNQPQLHGDSVSMSVQLGADLSYWTLTAVPANTIFAVYP